VTVTALGGMIGVATESAIPGPPMAEAPLDWATPDYRGFHGFIHGVCSLSFGFLGCIASSLASTQPKVCQFATDRGAAVMNRINRAMLTRDVVMS